MAQAEVSALAKVSAQAQLRVGIHRIGLRARSKLGLAHSPLPVRCPHERLREGQVDAQSRQGYDRGYVEDDAKGDA